MVVVAEAVGGAEAIDVYRRHRPDVLLMDLRLQAGMNGIEATRAICREFAEARIIVLTTFDNDEDVHRALQAGARSYLIKDVIHAELLNAVRAVHRGELYLTANIAARLAARLSHPELTPREIEILKLVVNGMSNKKIGFALNISEHTVKNHLKNILGKLGANDRTHAATIALQRGIITLQ